MKRLTRRQIEGRKDQAARFTETVLGDPKRAQEIRDESLEDYAARRRVEITNPTSRRTRGMPRKVLHEVCGIAFAFITWGIGPIAVSADFRQHFYNRPA